MDMWTVLLLVATYAAGVITHAYATTKVSQLAAWIKSKFAKPDDPAK